MAPALGRKENPRPPEEEGEVTSGLPAMCRASAFASAALIAILLVCTTRAQDDTPAIGSIATVWTGLGWTGSCPGACASWKGIEWSGNAVVGMCVSRAGPSSRELKPIFADESELTRHLPPSRQRRGLLVRFFLRLLCSLIDATALWTLTSLRVLYAPSSLAR